MSAILFPIAANAQSALHAPLGHAARASQAALAAAGEVRFVTEMVGPAFASQAAALDAFAGRLDDERPDRRFGVQPEDRYLTLREVMAAPPNRTRRPAKPAYADGRRWPMPAPPPKTVWRLSISYWRILGAEEAAISGDGGQTPAPDEMRALRARLERPMTPLKPQKALDIGLFEVRPPEAPHILMPDE